MADIRANIQEDNIRVTVSQNTIRASVLAAGPAGADGSGSVWGGIGGTLSNQTDLQTALDTKQAVLTGLTSSVAELNTLDGITSTVTELNYTDGVTSAIQTQLDAKQPLDADLTTIAGLTATTNNFLVAVSSAWASRTPTQAKTTLSLENVDNTSDATKNAASVTLTNKTLTAPTIGGAAQLAEGGSIALDAALSADGTYSGITRAGTAGTTLAFGDLVYLAAADSRWELTDADAASTSGDVLIGMCVLAAASDGSATTILLQGNIRADTAFPTLTISAPAYVGTTAGDIQVAQPSGTDDVIRVVGFALTADELYFNPSQDYITHT